MTRPALLVFVSARTLAATAALLLLAAVFVSCSDTQEEVGPDVPLSATVSSSPSPIAPTATPVVTTEPSPEPVPTGWQIYVDPVLAFSLVHPSDLTFKDLTGPSAPDGMNQRVIEFRSPQDPARAVAISVSANSQGMTLKDWAIQFAACVPDTVSHTEVSGKQAITCTSDALIPGPAAVVAYSNLFYFISTTKVAEAEFQQLLSLIQI